jgi:ATP-dependent RNA helicase DeaD
MSAFENVEPALARVLNARGFNALTPVQSAVLSPDVQNADMVVSAQTGSGKTVAFGLALGAALLDGSQRLGPAGAPRALIIAPTRELAMQVRGELEWLFAPAGGRIASCVGGMDSRDERRALNHGAHIAVGTPGRLVDHIRRGALEMHALETVVLDEADEMLNLGFREELEFILEASPVERRTLMFSATMPRAIEALAQTYQRNAVRVNTVSARTQHADIVYRALVAAGHDSENAIFNVLRYYGAANAIVFCGTRAAVTRLASRFANRGLSVVALSGELSQNERTKALQAMRDHRAQVCVATDVAARGIDLPDLDLVVHADLPKNTEALLHRSGRTGRAGRKGASVLIVPYSARRRTERLLREANINAEWAEPPSADDIKRRDDERLLSDPLLAEPLQGGEQAIVHKLLAAHEPMQIAAAFVRL